jgi:RNA polymerase sigma-70 factor (ECF subfamily)
MMVGSVFAETTPAIGPHAATAEIEIVRSFIEGPSEATFVPVFLIFAPRILRYFELRGCSTPVAEDLTQDVMLVLYRRAGTVRDISSVPAWAYGIARNTLLMHLRRQGRRVEQVELEGLCDRLPAKSFDPLAKSMLHESLKSLDVDSRRILEMRYLDGLEYHEIAAVLTMPLGTVQWKAFDAKKKLAKWMNSR